jgi:thioesterase domain-containing protein
LSTHIAKYQQLVHQKIPITQAMGWQIVRLDKDVIRCKAPLVNNINIHGTGFAGSIYALAMASAWTLVQFLLDHHQLENVLVAADASIKYLKPVKTDIPAEANQLLA